MRHNGWVFISHSHQDIKRVRRIRNRLEELGFEPLLFFLKCLSDKNEIEGLIKREIDEREWFIYLDSENARASTWVQTERDYIETRQGKKIFTISLDDTEEEQMAAIEHLARQMKVFIAASRNDNALTKRLTQAFFEKDMFVMTDADVIGGSFWDRVNNSHLEEAARSGFVLLIVSEHTADSEAVLSEVKKTVSSGGKLVPIFVGNAYIPIRLMEAIGTVPGVHISTDPTEDEIKRVVEAVLSRVEYYDSDMTKGLGFRYARTITLPPISRINSDFFALCENLETVTVPPSVIYMEADVFDGLGDILVRCYADSYAERFCKIHQIRYEIIGDVQ
ncbi:MAG: toll/interleukin-1 receptor domain-containing protein [Clostridia bacterium]|nr:toll/interleukin-1 receptor domain-containing protein [Clostridia bacterium]